MHSSTQALQDAIAHNTNYDAFAPVLSGRQWGVLESYLQRIDLPAGQGLIDQGAQDRNLFLIESGVVSIHLVGAEGQMHLAILNAGSVVGEGSFFSHLPRSANVSAMNATRLWRLTPPRFGELSIRQPELALELVVALGSVIARRMGDRLKQVAVT
ncbi:MAG: cyclic nucleotide-binding domain-containing protein [Variovorax sp.]|jgi:CRP-like cAMP-binding protein|nr:MAG: cyclic nucleotide-binding domain-containing protein [Variovorax sp.]